MNDKLLEATASGDTNYVVKHLSIANLDRSNCTELFCKAIQTGNLEILEILINLVRTISEVKLSNIFVSALREASYIGNLEAVKLLLANGAKVNYSLNYKYEDIPSALILAAQENHFEIVKLLVESGANANEYCQIGSAIWMAAVNGDEKIFNYLYPLSNPELQKEAEEQLAYSLRQKQRKEVANPLINLLNIAIYQHNFDEIRKIVATDVDINGFDEDGSTCLLNAVIEGEIHIIKLLLQRGADPNLGDDEIAETPIIATICRGKKSRNQICSILIDAGADVNKPTCDEMTAIMWAVRLGLVQIVKTLLQFRANIRIRDSFGKTALDYALEESKKDYSWLKNPKQNEILKLVQEANIVY
jgi:uncharacterized protein